jgi:endonuclease YncB( thermonuclease family)
MSRVASAAVLAGLLVATPLVASADIVGKARAVDGDTLELAGKSVHLYGIDAPEDGQTCLASGKPWACGREAAFVLAFEVGNHWITCKVMETVATDRVNAVCYAGPHDLGAVMVSRGWALARRGASKDYVAEEAWAKQARRGLWRGRFVAPWDWRAGKRLADGADVGARR